MFFTLRLKIIPDKIIGAFIFADCISADYNWGFTLKSYFTSYDQIIQWAWTIWTFLIELNHGSILPSLNKIHMVGYRIVWRNCWHAYDWQSSIQIDLIDHLVLRWAEKTTRDPRGILAPTIEWLKFDVLSVLSTYQVQNLIHDPKTM